MTDNPDSEVVADPLLTASETTAVELESLEVEPEKPAQKKSVKAAKKKPAKKKTVKKAEKKPVEKKKVKDPGLVFIGDNVQCTVEQYRDGVESKSPRKDLLAYVDAGLVTRVWSGSAGRYSLTPKGIVEISDER